MMRKTMGPVSDDGYMSPSEEKKEASSSDTTTTPTTIPTTANEGEEKDFIKKAWQSQLGSSEVSPREERGTNSMSSSLWVRRHRTEAFREKFQPLGKSKVSIARKSIAFSNNNSVV